jgi:prevent-host-death family protein
MKWKVGQAKQQLSEVIRQSAKEPQVIYNREKPVAAVIAAEDLASYSSWREQSRKPTLAEFLGRAQQICAEEGYAFELSPRGPERPNALLQMLEEEERRATRRHKRRK